MKYTENIGLPIVEDNDLYSKEINNLAFEEIDKNIEALAERIDLIDDPETGLGNLLEIMVRKEDIAQDLDNPEREKVLSTEALADILDKKTEEIETLIEDTDNATRLDLTNKVLLNKVVDVALNASDELIVTYGDGTELNVGVVGTGGTVAPSSENKIEVDTDTDEEYILKITTDGTDFLTPNLKGAGDNIFVGIDVDGETGDIVVDVADARLGDVYINSDNGNIYVREDLNGIENNWTFKGNIKGKQGKSNYDLAVDNGFIGTEQDYLDSLVAENIEALIVDAKPVLADPSTELKTWYFYQVDGDTDGSAWKYKMVLPSVADYPAGDYCVYYDLKPYCGTFTVGSPALTNKDRYKYYAIMDLQAVTTELIREDLDTGNTVVLETVQCIQQEPTTHIVINEHIETLGKWVQTLYIGATKDTASEVTINTGTKTTGFINNAQLINYVGDRTLLTTDAQDTLVSAINELNGILRTSNTTTLNTNSTTIIDAINELNTKSDINIYILRSDNILDFAVSQDAYKYKIIYANNCDGLPNGEKYGFCYIGTSHDPLYKTVIFNSITTAKRWSTYRYPDPSNPFADGTWSAWREDVTSDAIVTALNELNTDAQIPSAKAMYNYTKDRTAKTYTNILQLGLTAPIATKDIYNAMPNGSVAYIEVNSSTITDAPCNTGILIINKVNIGSFNIVCKKSSAGNIEPNDVYLGNLKGNDGAGLTWTEVGSGGANTGGGAITDLAVLGLTTPTNIQDVFNAVPSGNILILGCTEDEVMGIPTYSGILTIDKYSASRFNIMFKKSFSGSVATNDLYLGSLKGIDGSDIVWNRTMIDTDVVIALDDTVTDNQVPSARAVYNLVKNDVGSQLEIQGIKDDITELQNKAIEDITYANGELTFTKGDTTQKTIGIASKITELQDVNISNPVASEVIAYSASTGKWINSPVSTTDQYVKMTNADATGSYLADLIDNDTVVNNNNKLEVNKIKGQQITVDELNTLLGMDTNVKDSLNAIATGMVFKDVVPTKADLPQGALNGFVYIVNSDETDNGNRNAYIYSDVHSDYVLVGTSGLEARNFTTNPINLETEVTGILPTSNIDTTGFVNKSTDIVNSMTYPIPTSDLEKIPNLQVLKQINTEISNALSKKVNTTDVVTALSPSNTDTQVPSAKAVYTELSNKLDASAVANKIDSSAIVTVLDDTVTDEQIASAKVVYDKLQAINEFDVKIVDEILDLNDIIETGIYYFTQTYTPVNIPVGVNGWLVVMKGNGSNVVKQVWYRQGTANANSYNTFERYKGGDTWSEWTKFLTEREYYKALDSGNPGIPQNADLNDYLTPGVYTCTSGTNAKTFANCPHIDSNFKLIVNRNTGSTDFFGYQMIVGTIGSSIVKDVCIYYRGVTTSNNVYVFSNWKIMSGSTVANVENKDVTSSVDTTVVTANSIAYTVKNGICYVRVNNLKPLVACNETVILPNGTLPKASTSLCYANINTWSETTMSTILLQPNTNGSLDLWCNSNALNKAHYGMFSYPVAE